MSVLLKNGKIYDGTGGASYTADLLIEDGKIAKIGAGLTEKADETVDCGGLCIAPGFIDAHSHNDWFAARIDNDRFFVPFLEQGITTQVAGNCGFSPFGFDADTPHKDLIGSGLFSLGDAEGDTSTLDGFERAIKNLPVNLVPLLGHGSPRISVAGYDSRPLTEEELEREDALIEKALTDGAAGVSFGLMYEPDRYAPYDELKRAARIAQKHGKVLTVHGRACSAASTSYNPPVGGKAHNVRALEEMAQIARETGVKLQYSHLIFVGKSTWKTLDACLDLIDRLNAEGLEFWYDSFAFTYGASVITVALPPWYLTLPAEKRRSRWNQLKLKAMIDITKKMLGFDFGDIVITWVKEGEESLVGKTVREIADEWGVGETEAYIRLVELSEGKGRVLMHKYLTKDILKRLMSDDKCLFMTDAWVEENGKQNPAGFSCFPKFFDLAREFGVDFARIIRRMTGATADRFGIEGRGYVREGCAADLIVFDENAIGVGESDESRPRGVEQVYVNGARRVERGAFVPGASSGSLLRQPEA